MALKKDDFKSGIIFAPYIMAHTSSPISNDRYDAFMKAYEEKHKFCPNCGSVGHSTTLIDYVVNIDKPDEFKDMNRCTCSKCGYTHTMHDRISNIELRKIKLKDLKIK